MTSPAQPTSDVGADEPIRLLEAVTILAGGRVVPRSGVYRRQARRLETAERHEKISALRQPGRSVRYSRAEIGRLRSNLAARGIDANASTIHFAAVARGWRARREGFIRQSDAGRLLEVNERQLAQLYESGTIEGKRVAAGRHGETWLLRSSLAAYCFSRPRCVVCQRRVIGGSGQGCSRHRYQGRKQSEQTRRKIAESHLSGPPVERHCEWCGERFELLPSVARGSPGRFCSNICQRAWLHPPDGVVPLEKLFEGLERWRQAVASAKASRRLLSAEELSKALWREVRRSSRPSGTICRSPGTIRRHVAEGHLKAAQEFVGVLLFSESAVADYMNWLRDHPDGRLQRFNAVQFGLDWTEARFGRQSGAWQRRNGRVAALVGKGDKRSRAARDLERQIAEAVSAGMTRADTARRVGCTERYVREVAKRLGLPQGRPGRRVKTGTTPSRLT